MQLKFNESICECQTLNAKKELADTQIEGLMKGEKESQESVNDIGSFMLQLHEERNRRFRECEDLKIRFDALKTETNYHLARKYLHLEIVSRPFVVWIARPSRL
jgi:predicted nuclease with TOPRIM domain